MPTGRRGRLLALSLALVTLGGVYLLAVAPLFDLYAEREANLDDGRMLLPRLQAMSAALPAYRARVAELHAAARTRKVTLDGASDAIASANLQSRIEAFAVAVGATIGLRLALNGPYETLVKLLAKLEEATPPLIVDNLQIHGVLRRPGLPQSGGTDIALDAGLDVYGFRSDDKSVAATP
jgi:general secretion pathway protein M